MRVDVGHRDRQQLSILTQFHEASARPAAHQRRSGIRMKPVALLIPGMNSTGAAIGTLVAEIVVLIIQVKALGPVLPPLLANISYGKIILGTFAATLASIWLKMTGLRNFIILIAGAAVFFAVYFGLLCLMKEKMTVSIVQGVAGRLKHRSRPKE